MREFRKFTGRNNRPQVWNIWVDKNNLDTYIIEWGVLDGVMQRTSDKVGSCGNPDHSDYQTPEQYAITCMDREIRKKLEHGYVEYIDGQSIGEVECTIDFSKPLAKNTCFYKPKKTISDKKLNKIYKSGNAVWTLKRDGMCHIVVKRNDDIEIYSRRMDIVTEKFPHIVSAIDNLNLPNNTILLGEMCLLDKHGRDNFEGVSKICRSDKDLSLAYQNLGKFPKRRKNENTLGLISYYVFDIPFYDGTDLISTSTVKDRLILLKNIFYNLTTKLNTYETMLEKYHISPIEVFDTNPNDDVELAKQLKIEGFVVLDVNACYGDKAYSFDGKAHRPEGIYKRKPEYEDEFVITGLCEGTGKNRGRLGAFTIKQIHPSNNKWVDCGKCGGGFTEQQRIEFWEIGDELIGKTIKVKFDSRQPPKDGVYSLRFPVYKGVSDKTPEECVAQHM